MYVKDGNKSQLSKKKKKKKSKSKIHTTLL